MALITLAGLNLSPRMRTAIRTAIVLASGKFLLTAAALNRTRRACERRGICVYDGQLPGLVLTKFGEDVRRLIAEEAEK